jgi:hypothetical protein
MSTPFSLIQRQTSTAKVTRKSRNRFESSDTTTMKKMKNSNENKSNVSLSISRDEKSVPSSTNSQEIRDLLSRTNETLARLEESRSLVESLQITLDITLDESQPFKCSRLICFWLIGTTSSSVLKYRRFPIVFDHPLQFDHDFGKLLAF